MRESIERLLANLQLFHRIPDDERALIVQRLFSYGRRKLHVTALDALDELHNAVVTLRQHGFKQNRAGRWVPADDQTTKE